MSESVDLVPEEKPRDNYATSCTMAGLLTFVAPVILLGLSFTNPAILMMTCALILTLPVVGFIWGIVLFAKMMASGRGSTPDASSPDAGPDAPRTDAEGRML